MLLADLGADVAQGRAAWHGRPVSRAFKGELYSPHFQTYNRNKRSITLNTKDKPPTWPALTSWSAEADVYIQNFRPGVAENIGAGYERLQGPQP